MNYSAILDTYELSDLIDMNDLTQEDVLEYLVAHGVLTIPEVVPVTYD